MSAARHHPGPSVEAIPVDGASENPTTVQILGNAIQFGVVRFIIRKHRVVQDHIHRIFGNIQQAAQEPGSDLLLRRDAQTLRRYQNRAIETEQVIELLLLAKTMWDANER